jgi:penicillin amidase
MRIVVTLLSCIALLGLIFFLNKRDVVAPGAPALGEFLSPFHGFWQNAWEEDIPDKEGMQLPGLKQAVELSYDERLVPHIKAQNEQDLYYAQGFVTASLRLWQMEMQVRAASGTLAEVLGPSLKGADMVAYDRKQRRLGMVEAAKTALNQMKKNPKTSMVLTAYTAGVNAWICQLKPEKFPLEYKILGYKPEKWTELKSALLLKMMAYDLSFSVQEVSLTTILQKYGKAVVDELFPRYSPYTDPIIPDGTKWDFKPELIPRQPNSYSCLDVSDFREQRYQESNNGSNNWAISGAKSANGYPMLANDPHLGIKLPSIWLEMHLQAPGVNVYGVTIPGAPTIIIGFNEKIAWGVTNVGADVTDWYKITFRDGTYREYRYDNSWMPTRWSIDTIHIKGGGYRLDTIISTQYGPVVNVGSFSHSAFPENCALQWVAHFASNELLTFYLLNRAKDYEDYKDAIEHYACPAQNFAYIDQSKNIALWSNGRFPLKWREQGKFILDGNNPEHSWQGWVPQAHNPHILNPKRGFVSSANQSPTDTTYPYYLDWKFETFERGARINQRLALMEKATIDSLRGLQNDNYNLLAEKTLPKLLSFLNEKQLLQPSSVKMYHLLHRWNYQNNANSAGAAAFEVWWDFLENAIWEDDFGNLTYPDRAVTAQLVLSTDSSRWYDDVRTTEKEKLGALVYKAFYQAHDSLLSFGAEPHKWRWDAVKNTHLAHLARIPGLGVDFVSIGGGQGIVNATKSTHGASWRMIVNMGYPIKAKGIYPGGQSGNPASKYYDNNVKDWAAGKLNPIYFPLLPKNKIKASIQLTPSS